ncbi:MAG: diguanylate cyclase [Syntrophobacteraceae bacterium]
MMEKMTDVDRIRAEHQIYADLTRTLTATLDLSEVLEIIMNKVRELLRPENWSLLLMEDEGKHLVFEIAVGVSGETLKGSRLQVGEGIAGWVAETARSLLVSDARADERFCKRFDDLCDFTTRSLICVPMTNRGRVLGVIELVNRMEETAFSDEDMGTLEILAEYAAIAIQNAAMYKRIQRLVISDEHTSLYNARHLYDVLDRELTLARTEGHEVSMVFFDLDHFKQVNDVHGHLCGSKVLREVGHLIQGMSGPTVVPFRYGGDEFIVVLTRHGKDEALRFAHGLRERVNSFSFLEEEGLGLHLTASFGVATFPSDARDAIGLLGLADMTMYQVKEASRDGVAAAGPA